jgi:hypothetical protein
MFPERAMPRLARLALAVLLCVSLAACQTATRRDALEAHRRAVEKWL